jgi:hypothetical protein
MPRPERSLLPVCQLLAVLAALAPPAPAAAQSAISGVVVDSSGGVLPGVSVEAESPVLIEKVRTTVTDSQGLYTLADLRPGVYIVQFSLTGFTSVRREGVQVSSNVNVPVNAELRIGGIEETLTVSGQAAAVDVRNAGRTAVLSRDVLDSLPTSRTYTTVGAIIPGIKLTKPDIGGTQAVQQAYPVSRGMTNHNDNMMMVDGMPVRLNGTTSQAYTNFSMVEEVTYQTTGIGADTSGGGVRVNMIPKDGGNTFRGNVFFGGSSGNWQSNNVTQELIDRGLPSPTATDYLYDLNPSFGGPVKRDAVWFFGSYRRLVLNTLPGGSYADGRPAVEDQWIDSGSARLTWQVSPPHRLTAYIDRAWKGKGHDFTDLVPAEVSPARIDPETAASKRDPSLYYIAYAKWTSTLTNKLLLENGLSLAVNNYSIIYQPGVAAPPGSPNFLINFPRIDILRGTLTGASDFTPNFQKQDAYALSSAMTYAGGAHHFKTGVQWRFGPVESQLASTNGDLNARYRSGIPDSVTVRNAYVEAKHYLNADLGLFAQDSWTLGRWTANMGVRFDYLNAEARPTTAGAGRFVPTRSFDGNIPDLPRWFDVSPRLGIAYDVFGTAKTAIRASASKYTFQNSTDIASRYNPMSQASDRRNWFDCDVVAGTSTCSGRALPSNGDGIPQDYEIGPSGNRNFGISTGRRPDPGLNRQYNWDYSVGVDHAVTAALSITGAWYYRTFHNVEGQYNTLVDPVSDWVAFTTINPLTLEPMTIFNLMPSKLGLVDLVDRNSDINTRVYNGFEASFRLRLPGGGTALGGFTRERTQSTTCDTSNPNQWLYCDQTGELKQELGAVEGIPFRNEFKLAGSYPLPGRISASVSLLSYAGPLLAVNWTPGAAVFPNGQRTQPVTVPLIAPGTKYGDRWNQVDVGVKKSVRLGHGELDGQVDVFNLFNSSAVLTELQVFGPSLGQPTSILQGRLLRLSASFRF